MQLNYDLMKPQKQPYHEFAYVAQVLAQATYHNLADETAVHLRKYLAMVAFVIANKNRRRFLMVLALLVAIEIVTLVAIETVTLMAIEIVVSLLLQ
jgi:hypothetical protein